MNHNFWGQTVLKELIGQCGGGGGGGAEDDSDASF